MFTGSLASLPSARRRFSPLTVSTPADLQRLLDTLMMCDNLPLYKPSVPLTSITSPSDTPRLYPGVKRKLSEYEEVDSDEEEEEDEEEDEPSTPPCPILQRRHSDTVPSCSYGSAIVKRRCTYSSLHEQEEEKRSVLVESYRKLRGVKKPKLQVSLLICNLIKRLEKTFAKAPPLAEQQVHYYSPQRTSYRSTSSDSLYLSCTLASEEVESSSSNQQYSSYESEKVTNSSMYHPSSAETYWLAQSNFAVPVVSSSEDEDDGEISFHAGGGDYLDLSDNTLSSSSSSPPTVDGSSSSTSSTTLTKLLVDTNNNHHSTEDYYHYPSPAVVTDPTFFYPPNGSRT